ncbi:BTAD domain-containing putative transcriptional regulator [Longispora sp. K20-0274]|uniref:AfsR/SARP family transcriptional regulator n=1 Tax=Longispora sp. K20-0274 TaxID=3088255 RepID=UPI00399B921D
MQFRILGPLQTLDGARDVTPGGHNLRVLLAVLLSQPNRAVSVDALTGAVWSATPPRTAGKNLQVYVHKLRRALGEDRIVRHPHGYALLVAPGELDADEFGTRTARGTAALAAGDVRGGRARLDDALALWRGDVLADLAEVDALRDTVTRLTEQRLYALEARIDADLQLGAHDEIAAELESLLLEHPLRERLRGQRIVALYRSARVAEALRVYQEGRQLLVDELGVEPGLDLQRMHLAILRGVDPGPSARSAPPPTVPAQLPSDVAGFTGRHDQLAALDLLVSDRAEGRRPHAIAAIVGPGGVGKSALAVRWAHARLAEFPDGQLHIDLRGSGTGPELGPLEALGRLLRGLGCQDAELAPTLDERAGQYRSTLAGRRIVLVLDNAASSDQVRPLLPGTGPQTTLITSRSRLDGLVVREGAYQVELSPLPRADAVRLVRAATGVPDGEEPQLTALVELCDRLPLALRIAAARLTGGSRGTLAALVGELGDEHRRLSALSLPSGDAAVRTVFAGSFAALSPAARDLLAALGLHPGPQPSLAACAALGGVDRTVVADLLDELLARHMVVRTGPDRYQLHDLVRLYAREHAAGQGAALERVLRWYLSVANGADLTLRPYRALRLELGEPPAFGSDAEAVGWFDAESDNLLAAVAAAESDHPVLCWQLAGVLHAWLERRQRRTDWLTVYPAAIRAAEAVGDLSAEAFMRQSLGVANYYLCRKDVAIDLLEQVLDARRRGDDRQLLTTALMNLGNLRGDAGDYEGGVALLREALTMAESLPDNRLAAGTMLNCLGWAHQTEQRWPQAVDCYQRAADLARELGDAQAQSYAEGNLATVYAAQRDHDRALRFWRRAAQSGRRAADRRLEANGLAGMGRARIAIGRPEEARGDLRRALATYEDIADPMADDVRALLAQLDQLTAG